MLHKFSVMVVYSHVVYSHVVNKAHGRPVKSKKLDFTVMDKSFLTSLFICVVFPLTSDFRPLTSRHFGAYWFLCNPKSEIRNPKSAIRNLCLVLFPFGYFCQGFFGFVLPGGVLLFFEFLQNSPRFASTDFS